MVKSVLWAISLILFSEKGMCALNGTVETFNDTSSHFEKLHHEIVGHIVGFINDPKELGYFAQTNKCNTQCVTETCCNDENTKIFINDAYKLHRYGEYLSNLKRKLSLEENGRFKNLVKCTPKSEHPDYYFDKEEQKALKNLLKRVNRLKYPYHHSGLESTISGYLPPLEDASFRRRKLIYLESFNPEVQQVHGQATDLIKDIEAFFQKHKAPFDQIKLERIKNDWSCEPPKNNEADTPDKSCSDFVSRYFSQPLDEYWKQGQDFHVPPQHFSNLEIFKQRAAIIEEKIKEIYVENRSTIAQSENLEDLEKRIAFITEQLRKASTLNVGQNKELTFNQLKDELNFHFSERKTELEKSKDEMCEKFKNYYEFISKAFINSKGINKLVEEAENKNAPEELIKDIREVGALQFNHLRKFSDYLSIGTDITVMNFKRPVHNYTDLDDFQNTHEQDVKETENRHEANAMVSDVQNIRKELIALGVDQKLLDAAEAENFVPPVKPNPFLSVHLVCKNNKK